MVKVLTTLVIIFLSLALVACGLFDDESNDEDLLVQVVFVVSEDVTINQDYIEVVVGNVINQQVASKDGYVLLGWYLELQFTNQWDFAESVIASKSLFARWQVIAADTIVITFDGGLFANVSPNSVNINLGSKIPTPTAIKAGYVLLGWYLDIMFITQWDFDQFATESKILFARWEAIPPASVVVTFNLNGGQMPNASSLLVEVGSFINEPAGPTKAATELVFYFSGWYLDGKLFNFNTPVVDNITLVAQWHTVHLAQRAALGQTFYDNGFLWRVIEIDEQGRRLIMTEHVWGTNTMYDSRMYWLRRQRFVPLNDTDRLRPALNLWWSNVSSPLQALALPVTNLDGDYRFNNNFWQTVANPSHWLRTYGNIAQVTEGVANHNSLFILSLSEFNLILRNSPFSRALGYRLGYEEMMPQRWWLRSPGDNNFSAAYVDHNGNLRSGAATRAQAIKGFRPAMWISA